MKSRKDLHMINSITKDMILQDKDKRGKNRKWAKKKLISMLVCESMKRLKMIERALRMESCSNYLLFKECFEHVLKKLAAANFCYDRLCPLCNWRRSRMLGAQIITILHEAAKREKMKFISLSLTVKNPTPEELAKTIDNMSEGVHRLFKYKQVDDVVLGWVRCLEITYDNEKTITHDMYYGNLKRHMKSKIKYYTRLGLAVGDKNPNYDHYHPHFHILLGVNPRYLSDKRITEYEWMSMWRKALKIDYAPEIDAQEIRPKREGQDVEAAVAETAKYSVKESDYVFKSTKDTDRVVAVLAEVLANRRLVGFGKIFKEVKKDLKLKDVEAEDADLVGADKETECKCPICQSKMEDVLYTWHMGFKNYITEKRN